METKADRIRRVLDATGVPERQRRRELAEVCRISYQAVREWFLPGANIDISADHLAAIAKYYGARLEYLATGELPILASGKTSIIQDGGSQEAAPPAEDPPLIQWPDIQGHLAGAQTQVIKRCKVNTAAYGPRTFWVPVRDNAMVGGMLFIPQGHRIAVDPDSNWRARLQAGSQTFVLAQLQAGEEPVFRRLSKEGGQLWLVAADTRYPLLGPIREEDVIGQVLEAVMEL